MNFGGTRRCSWCWITWLRLHVTGTYRRESAYAPELAAIHYLYASASLPANLNSDRPKLRNDSLARADCSTQKYFPSTSASKTHPLPSRIPTLTHCLPFLTTLAGGKTGEKSVVRYAFSNSRAIAASTRVVEWRACLNGRLSKTNAVVPDDRFTTNRTMSDGTPPYAGKTVRRYELVITGSVCELKSDGSFAGVIAKTISACEPIGLGQSGEKKLGSAAQTCVVERRQRKKTILAIEGSNGNEKRRLLHASLRATPRVKYQDTGWLKISGIARDDRHTVHQRCRSNQRITNRTRVGHMESRASLSDSDIYR